MAGGVKARPCARQCSGYFFFFEDFFLLLFLEEACFLEEEVFLLPVEVVDGPAMAFFEELDFFEEEVAFFDPFDLPLPLP